MRREEFLYHAQARVSPAQLRGIAWAYQIAKGAHRNQVRSCGRRYFDHPREVALIFLRELKVGDAILIILALLHDIMEDSFILFFDAVERLFGEEVAISLHGLTKPTKAQPALRALYLPNLTEHGTWRAKLVKLADRAHNMRTLGGFPVAKQASYAAETRLEFLPEAQLWVATMPADMQRHAVYLIGEITRLCAVAPPPRPRRQASKRKTKRRLRAATRDKRRA